MRIGLATGLSLCLAVLLGFAPPRVLAADPPASGAASTASATASAVGPGNTVAQQEASAPKSSAGPDASAGHSASDRPQHALQHAPGTRELAARPPLDLSAPPMSRVMTPEQVQALIGEPDDAESDEVMVEQGRYEEPVPQGQVRALAWALMHPFQAWRIFTPVTDQ